MLNISVAEVKKLLKGESQSQSQSPLPQKPQNYSKYKNVPKQPS
jgi:hypothetical protein